MKQSLLGVAVALFLTAAAGALAQAIAEERYEPDAASASQITVEGTSTIHDWKAKGEVIHGHLILQEAYIASLWSKLPSPQKITPRVEVKIPVLSLKSGNSTLDKNMHKALMVQEQPLITYRLEAAEIQPGRNDPEADTERQASIVVKGILAVAGVSQAMEIPVQVRRLPDNKLEVSGETILRMTDFGINPPRLMMGVLRTGDEVHVRWTWVLIPAADQQPE